MPIMTQKTPIDALKLRDVVLIDGSPFVVVGLRVRDVTENDSGTVVSFLAGGSQKPQEVAYSTREVFQKIITVPAEQKRAKRGQGKEEWLASEIRAQEQWIVEHGANLVGYVSRYGSKDDAEHYGSGGEAIFKADRGALVELVYRWEKLTDRKWEYDSRIGSWEWSGD